MKGSLGEGEDPLQVRGREGSSGCQVALGLKEKFLEGYWRTLRTTHLVSLFICLSAYLIYTPPYSKRNKAWDMGLVDCSNIWGMLSLSSLTFWSRNCLRKEGAG